MALNPAFYLFLLIFLLHMELSSHISDPPGSNSSIRFPFFNNPLPLIGIPVIGLEFNAYAIACPIAEMMISITVREFFQRDPSIAAGLLRMLFHDCFVQGCDASILLQSTPDNLAERDASPNLHSLRGFEVIDEIKRRLEQVCPNTVSCADILVLSTRDAVIMAGGPGYPLTTGRRDSISSFAEQANQMLPDVIDTLPSLIARFEGQGFNAVDLVALLGGHTLGHSRCRFISPRIYNFTGDGSPDPRLDKNFVKSLKNTCPKDLSEHEPFASLDLGSEFLFDNSYYKNLMARQVLLGVDLELLSDSMTRDLVQRFANDEFNFFRHFAASMMKLSSFRVLTAPHGTIRQNCSISKTRA